MIHLCFGFLISYFLSLFLLKIYLLLHPIYLTGQALSELGKDKASMKQVEGNTAQFLKTLSHVEQELSRHIGYLTQVSTGQLKKEGLRSI